MTGMLETVKQALCDADCDILAGIGSSMTPGGSAWEAWQAYSRRQARRGGRIDALTREDRQLLSGLFRHLGESGREAQELLLAGAIASLDRSLDAARLRAAEADRLYGSLGLLTGLMLALIVI